MFCTVIGQGMARYSVPAPAKQGGGVLAGDIRINAKRNGLIVHFSIHGMVTVSAGNE